MRRRLHRRDCLAAGALPAHPGGACGIIAPSHGGRAAANAAVDARRTRDEGIFAPPDETFPRGGDGVAGLVTRGWGEQHIWNAGPPERVPGP